MGRKPKLPDHTSGELTEYFDLDFCEQLGVEIGIEDFNELQVRLNIAGKHYQLALVSPPKSEQQKLIKLFNQKLNELDEIILNLGIPEINRLVNCALPGFSFSNLASK
ncbi:MAG: hypothetical protein AB2806_19585, partial [Candidatus Thiodiazotropha sp.]